MFFVTKEPQKRGRVGPLFPIAYPQPGKFFCEKQRSSFSNNFFCMCALPLFLDAVYLSIPRLSPDERNYFSANWFSSPTLFPCERFFSISDAFFPVPRSVPRCSSFLPERLFFFIGSFRRPPRREPPMSERDILYIPSLTMGISIRRSPSVRSRSHDMRTLR